MIKTIRIPSLVVAVAAVAATAVAAASFVEGCYAPIVLTTRTNLPLQVPSAKDVQAFLATPGNWPKIVTTSFGVEFLEDATIAAQKPMQVGSTVTELFGLPPVLALSVRWTCTEYVMTPNKNNNKRKRTKITTKTTPPLSATGGRLKFVSAEGLEGIARNCEMVFDIKEGDVVKEEGITTMKTPPVAVSLMMRYEPVSPLAVLAAPILAVDNAVAIKFLLPKQLNANRLPKLHKFRTLMGNLYGVAGIAHLADCVLGPSQLLTTAGAPPFPMLPLLGQVYALLWCCAGPLSFALSRTGSAGFADIGLIVYGLVEVIGAGLISATYASGEAPGIVDPILNATLVQAVVLAAWFYSANKKEPQTPS